MAVDRLRGPTVAGRSVHPLRVLGADAILALILSQLLEMFSVLPIVLAVSVTATPRPSRCIAATCPCGYEVQARSSSSNSAGAIPRLFMRS